MRKTVILVTLLLVFALSSCVGVPCDEVKRINDHWWETYNKDRRLTADEDAAYAKLDDAGKKAWKKAGKPVPKALSPRFVDAVKDFYGATAMEIDAFRDDPAKKGDTK